MSWNITRDSSFIIHEESGQELTPLKGSDHMLALWMTHCSSSTCSQPNDEARQAQELLTRWNREEEGKKCKMIACVGTPHLTVSFPCLLDTPRPLQTPHSSYLCVIFRTLQGRMSVGVTLSSTSLMNPSRVYIYIHTLICICDSSPSLHIPPYGDSTVSLKKKVLQFFQMSKQKIPSVLGTCTSFPFPTLVLWFILWILRILTDMVVWSLCFQLMDLSSFAKLPLELFLLLLFLILLFLSDWEWQELLAAIIGTTW